MRMLIAGVIFFLFPCMVSAYGGHDDKPTHVGFLYISPVGHEGFSFAHDRARKELEKNPNVTTTYVENVPEGPDAEQVIFEMANTGTDIIIATSFGFMDAVEQVSKQFPDKTFLHCSGQKAHSNLSSFFGRIYQARYLTGMVAGLMTETNTIGYVAAYPIPAVVRGINAFTLGAREVNPNAKVHVMWTQTWYDPLTEKEAGLRLVEAGADVLTQHQDSYGVQRAAAEKDVYAIGYHSDMSHIAKEKHLVAAVWNWYPFYNNLVTEVRSGSWKSGLYWPGIESNVVDISSFSPLVPREVQERILQKRQAIIDGSYVVFNGPVESQTGDMRIPEGATPSDNDLLHMNWFVKGVVGDIR